MNAAELMGKLLTPNSITPTAAVMGRGGLAELTPENICFGIGQISRRGRDEFGLEPVQIRACGNLLMAKYALHRDLLKTLRLDVLSIALPIAQKHQEGRRVVPAKRLIGLVDSAIDEAVSAKKCATCDGMGEVYAVESGGTYTKTAYMAMTPEERNELPKVTCESCPDCGGSGSKARGVDTRARLAGMPKMTFWNTYQKLYGKILRELHYLDRIGVKIVREASA